MGAVCGSSTPSRSVSQPVQYNSNANLAARAVPQTEHKAAPPPPRADPVPAPVPAPAPAPTLQKADSSKHLLAAIISL